MVQVAPLESTQDVGGLTEGVPGPPVQDIVIDVVRELAERHHVVHALRHLQRSTVAHRRNKTNNAVRGNSGQKGNAPNRAGCLL